MKISIVVSLISAFMLAVSHVAWAETKHRWSIVGPSSWYGGSCDPHDNNIPAYAPRDANRTPGVAMRTYSTRLKLFLLRGPNGRYVVVQHTDYGPASWTGKLVDLNYTAVMALGYPGPCAYSYPTGSYVYLRHLNRRGASWWAYRTKTKLDDKWIVKRWVEYKINSDKRKKARKQKRARQRRK